MNLWALPVIILFVGLIVANVWLEVAYRRRRRARRVDAWAADWRLPTYLGVHGTITKRGYPVCRERMRCGRLNAVPDDRWKTGRQASDE